MAAIFKPASAKVVYQPLGVVGIVSPWNFPVSLALTPLATALAAGNRVMLKPSEMTPATTDLLASMFTETFDDEQVAVVTGDAQIGSAFSSLPFDHIFFTGSIPVGRAIMRAASENLVPVTLELGGKSPIIVDAAIRCLPPRDASRLANAPMAARSVPPPTICFCPRARRRTSSRPTDKRSMRSTPILPTIATSPQFSTTDTSHACQGLVEDAKAKGARVIEIGTRPSGGTQSRMFPPTLLLDVTDDMAVMQEEIFGPILPVVTYDRLDEAIAYVNARPRPLALYFFGTDKDSQRLVWNGRPPAACSSTTPSCITRRTISRSAALDQAAWALTTAPRVSRP